MAIITIDGDRLEAEHVCCAIGNDKANRERARTKKDWMRAAFADGLVFKRLDERGKVFIEYMPVERVWKPIVGRNYMAINCLWVSGRFKGKGHSAALLAECVADAKRLGMDGVVAVAAATSRPFLTDASFYLGHGFSVVDRAEPCYELVALRLREGGSTAPRFTDSVRRGVYPHGGGFTFVYSNQCPFMKEYVVLLARVCEERGLPSRIVRLESAKEARELSSPFGTLGIFRDGKLLTHELMTEDRFRTLLDRL